MKDAVAGGLSEFQEVTRKAVNFADLNGKKAFLCGEAEVFGGIVRSQGDEKPA